MSVPVRVLVCGGRDFDDSRLLYKTMDTLHAQRGFTTLIHGDAIGADRMAERWAEDVGLPIVESFPADWEKYGKRAGIVRNENMLKYAKPDLVVAFPGGRGTAHMVSIAKDAGIEVIEVERQS